MNKTIVRYFIAAFFMLFMATNTALASSNHQRDYTRTTHVYITNNGSHDHIQAKSDGKQGAYVQINVHITYNTKTKVRTVTVNNVSITGYNADKYYYEVDQLNSNNIHLILQTQDSDIGYVRMFVSSTGHFTKHIKNFH